MAMPPAMPAHGVLAALATRAPTKAAASSMPSMAMLTTPALSHSTPARAPSAMGIDRHNVPSSRPMMLIESSRAAHASRAMMNSTSAEAEQGVGVAAQQPADLRRAEQEQDHARCTDCRRPGGDGEVGDVDRPRRRG